MDNCIEINNKGISYCINRNIELISVVMLLSDYYNKYPYLKTSFSVQYVDEILVYFNKFKEHPVIKEFEVLVANGFDFHLPLETMIFWDEIIKLREDELNKKLGDITVIQVNKFFRLLSDFVKVSSFDAFFQEHYNFYSYVLTKNIDLLPDINFKDILTEYYGISPKKMEIILSVTFGGVGFSTYGNSKISIILGTFNIENNIPIVVDKASFIEMVIHESSHSYINPYVNNIEISHACFTRLYTELHKGFQEQYGDNKCLIAEELVRSVTARLMYLYIDEGQGKKLMEREKSNNFIAVEPICFCLLNKYESNRKKYHTFKEFMPELVITLEKFRTFSLIRR